MRFLYSITVLICWVSPGNSLPESCSRSLGALPVEAGGPGEIRDRADDPAAATKLKLEYAESLPKGVDDGGCGRLMTIGSYWK